MNWWVWVLAGLGLLVAEVAVPGGVILVFFGVAALVLGILVALGLGGPLWMQLLLFSVLSLVSLFTLRGPVMRKLRARPGAAETDPVDSPVGETVVLLDDVAPQAEGRGEFRGTSWTVRNIGTRALGRGDKCVVEQAQGLKLFVRAG
jgi:membrane protein implicated in regulation of membrane protease activity